MGARLSWKRNLEFVAELVEVHNPDSPTFCNEFLTNLIRPSPTPLSPLIRKSIVARGPLARMAVSADEFLLGVGGATALGFESVLSELSEHPPSDNKQTPKIRKIFTLTPLKPDN